MCWRRRPREDSRRLHSRPALLPRLRADLVREPDSAGGSPAGAFERALGPAVPRQWRGVELSRLRQGLRLQARLADGSQARLPRLVAPSTCSRSHWDDCNVAPSSVSLLFLAPSRTRTLCTSLATSATPFEPAQDCVIVTLWQSVNSSRPIFSEYSWRSRRSCCWRRRPPASARPSPSMSTCTSRRRRPACATASPPCTTRSVRCITASAWTCSERQRRFVRVRTDSGVEGWIEQRSLVTQEVFDGFQKLAQDAKTMDIQAHGTTRAELNMHLTPAAGRRTSLPAQRRREG